MKKDRLARVNAMLLRSIGGYFERAISLEKDGFDRSILTVTGVDIAANLRTARVRVSFLGEESARRRHLRRLESHRAGLQRHLADTLLLKFTPRLHFVLDSSLEEGDRVLRLIESLEEEERKGDSAGVERKGIRE